MSSINRIQSLISAPALLGVILILPTVLFAQENYDQELAVRLLGVINGMRSKANIKPVTGDPRLAGTAEAHLLELSIHEDIFVQPLDELNLRKRISAANVLSTSVGEIRLMLPDLGLDDIEDRVEEALRVKSTLKTILDPKFSLAGLAVMRKGMTICALGILVCPLRVMPIEKAEQLFLDVLQRARTANGFPTFSVAPFDKLRQASCEMARKDSLAPAMNVLHTALSRETIAGTYAFTAGDPEDFSSVPEIRELLRARIRAPNDHRTIAVGICLANSSTYPNGSYWFIVALYDY
jgi:hypothetical protein